MARIDLNRETELIDRIVRASHVLSKRAEAVMNSTIARIQPQSGAELLGGLFDPTWRCNAVPRLKRVSALSVVVSTARLKMLTESCQ
jgi:hypothetical protein